MTLQHPMALLALAAVALAAVWSLRRPDRQAVKVSSLQFWQAAIESAEPAEHRRGRKISPSWWLLLLGACCAAFAAAGPMTATHKPEAVAVASTVAGPEVTLDALAGKILPDGNSQALWAAKNSSSKGQTVTLCTEINEKPLQTREIMLAAGERHTGVVDVNAEAKSVTVSIGPDLRQRATLRRGISPHLRAAMLGRPDEHLRRFLAAYKPDEVVTDVSQAEVALSVEEDPPAGMPGLIFDPRVMPPGWQRSEKPVGPLVLAEASMRPDALPLSHVDFAGVAVRNARLFQPAAGPQGEPLLSTPQGVLVLGTEYPRRIYVAFDPAESNTTWAAQESFVVFLANCLKYLAAETIASWQLDEPSLGTAPSRQAGDAGKVPPSSPSGLADSSLGLWPIPASLAGALWILGWYAQARPRKTTVS